MIIQETLDALDALYKHASYDTVLMSTRKRTSREEKHYDALNEAWPEIRAYIAKLERESEAGGKLAEAMTEWQTWLTSKNTEMLTLDKNLAAYNEAIKES